VDRFVFATFGLSVLNFLEILSINFKEARLTGTSVDGFTITVCRFSPPPAFFPRFWVATFLFIAIVGMLRKPPTPRILPAIGSVGALVIYLLWWLDSYRRFKNFTHLGIDFLSDPEIRQVAYLYHGTWSDLGIAASTVVCVVLCVEKLLDNDRIKPRCLRVLIKATGESPL
jgi:hypothetical protein